MFHCSHVELVLNELKFGSLEMFYDILMLLNPFIIILQSPIFSLSISLT